MLWRKKAISKAANIAYCFYQHYHTKNIFQEQLLVYNYVIDFRVPICYTYFNE